ncbi:transposase DDE domain protein [Anoxybacillus amylolyticus]|uniref:Transposase DDE domain protein n=1 Tax=Anoxybacteroides amylolyticum TaxID=294699 RepID=A0A160F142_9BACL|nr:transposase DDE domain protein [Anoxybacillus amylolyticus]
MTQIPHPLNLSDKVFISNQLQKKLHEAYQIAFWTPSRKNQKRRPSASWERWLKQKRKVVETVFSVLVDQYRITDIRAQNQSIYTHFKIMTSV